MRARVAVDGIGGAVVAEQQQRARVEPQAEVRVLLDGADALSRRGTPAWPGRSRR